MDSGVFTLASAPAAAAAFSRLDDYPAKISQSMHRARCKLPVALARALSDQPQLIAAASEAFYDREPTQMNVCQRMSQFPPEPSAMVSVQFNRVQYAKITSQDIHVPLAFNLPSVDSNDYKACVLGMKVVRICVTSEYDILLVIIIANKLQTLTVATKVLLSE
ncbi:hypothetical protein LPJ77_000739 [Coemansia sp. RSA 2523]|nr:hypothetical protein LPJ77_000739 [Coemansia sp. RSA 2523]